jgi:LysM repeat protein
MKDYYRYVDFTKKLSMEKLSMLYNVPVCMILNANHACSDLDLLNKSRIKIPYPCYCERAKTCVCDRFETRNQDKADLTDIEPKIINYFVDKDESLFDIAKKHSVTASLLIRLNKLLNPKDINRNQSLKIPVFEFETMIYHVLPADNLEKIASKFDIAPHLILGLNALEKPQYIYASMQLILPRK